MLFEWIKYLMPFGKNQITEYTYITKSFLQGMQTGSSSFLQYHHELKCKKHWEYQGMAAPINNCNDCWEYYAKKYKHRQVG